MLFLTFAKIGLFTFGGGYAMIPLIQRETVERKKWINDNDILDIVANTMDGGRETIERRLTTYGRDD